MLKITKKKKIIFLIILFILIIIFYYIYANKFTNGIDHVNNFIEDIDEENKKDIDKQKNEVGNKIMVHVSGAVNNEGIIELEEGSRISDAIEKVGGLKENAYTKDINLAYKVEDEMKIYIPTIEEKNNENNEDNKYDIENNNSIINSNIITNKDSKNNNTNNKNKSDKININTATKEQLENLPGIGQSTATKIIEYRNQNGKFKDIQDIKCIKGIGESKFNNIKDKICI